MDHPKPWLRYVDANAFDDSSFDVDGAPLFSSRGEELGKIDGLVVDANSGRAYYVVVDAGGWFKSRHFLVPVGQLFRGDNGQSYSVKLTKDQIDQFPGFDTDEFDSLSTADFKRINDGICSIFEPD